MALREALPKVSTTEYGWDSKNFDATVYDPCAELSVIDLKIVSPMGSSPVAHLFFNKGKFVGEPTGGQSPWVTWTRVDDKTVEGRFLYLTNAEGESNADPQGESTATFTWDGTKIAVTGDLPPKRSADPLPATTTTANGAKQLNTIAIYSPSNNIYCEISDDGGCGVLSLKVNGEGWTWHKFSGGTISQTATKRQDAPQYAPSQATIANYGDKLVKGNWTVISATTGITVTNEETGQSISLDRSGIVVR